MNMKKINKSFYTLTGFFCILSALAVVIFHKYLPFLLYHSVYYCESLVTKVSINPHSFLSWITVAFLSFILLLIITRCLLLLIQIKRLNNHLIEHTQISSTMASLLKKLNLKDTVHVVEEQRCFAFCFGIFNPKIYISTALISSMEDKELQAILIHEKYHIENKDTLKMFLVFIFQHIFPFVPLISDLIYNYRIEREIKADQAAIESLKGKAQIISVLRKLLLVETNPVSYVVAIADMDTLEPRIKALTQKDYSFRKYKFINIIISFLSLTFIVGISLSPIEAVEIHADNVDSTVLCANQQQCLRVCEENRIQKNSMPTQNSSSVSPQLLKSSSP